MNLNHINSSRFILLLLFPLLFTYSYILITNYTHGDQTTYRAVYESLSYAHFYDVVEVAQQYISASEWLTFYILWIPAANNINKDIFISLANLLLLSLLFTILRANKVNYKIIFLVLFNYYVIVLMTGAERLKFSIIFLLLAGLVNNRYLKVFFSLLSMLAHLQTSLFFGSLFLGQHSQTLVTAINEKRIKTKDISILVAGILVFLIFFTNQHNGIEAKSNAYLGDSLRSTDLMQIFLIFVAGIFVLKNKIQFIFAILPLATAVLLIGGQRVNMISVMIFIYLFLKEGKQNHSFIFIIMIYLSIKSIPFVRNIFEYGNGYYGI